MLVPDKNYYDLNLKETVSDNHLLGLWRLMKGYHWLYLGAAALLAVATLARTGIALVIYYRLVKSN